MTHTTMDDLTPYGKRLEAGAIVRRVSQELDSIQPHLGSSRDADITRGKIVAARAVLAEVIGDLP